MRRELAITGFIFSGLSFIMVLLDSSFANEESIIYINNIPLLGSVEHLIGYIWILIILALIGLIIGLYVLIKKKEGKTLAIIGVTFSLMVLLDAYTVIGYFGF
jgi:hypothetical protein